ncbi:MAG: hypothetical protein E6R04_10340 [Spirochaetes bacterium]|nr:MAG: hypothetical protein E6R04_10340 [Spirochaetota bacterium]
MATFTNTAGVAKVYLDNASGTPVDFSQYLPGANPETSKETQDSTTLVDAARKFVFGLEDGGELTTDIFLDTSGTVWTQLTALWAANYIGTLRVAPMGTATGSPRISREVGITKMGTPVQVGEIVKVSVTLKAHGETDKDVY